MTGFGIAIRRRAAILGVVAAFAAAVILALSPHIPGSAAPAPRASSCTVSMDAATVSPGELHAVVGSGFGPHQPVSVAGANGATADSTTDADGRFTVIVHVPTVLPGNSWRVEAISPDTTCSVSARVARQSSAASATGPVLGELAESGFPAIAVAIVGAFVLGCGLLFLTIGRRRGN